MTAPETHYTRSADGTNLAYQVTGEGPANLAVSGTGFIPIGLLWDDPGFVRFNRRLGRFSRTVWFDLRGMGASEGDPRDSNAGAISDADLSAVLDAVGFRRVALLGASFPGGRAIHFSATHPERVHDLILCNTSACYLRDEIYPWGMSPADFEQVGTTLRGLWGTGDDLEFIAPSRSADQRFREWWIRCYQLGAGPDRFVDYMRSVFEQDLRPLLPSISLPTLVLHRQGNRAHELGAGRYLAAHIRDARFVVLPGNDDLFYVGDTDAVVDEIEEFLTGGRSGAEGDVLTMTVLFTDIVSSTEHQSRVGPREWSRLTDRHDAMVRAALARHRGREVKTTGDGFLATFDATGRALRCAADILTGGKDIGLDLRAGVHTGEVEVRGDDIAGLAVTIAKRVCDLAGPGEVLASHAVEAAMAGSGVDFKDRGDHKLKGVPGTWRLFAVAVARS